MTQEFLDSMERLADDFAFLAIGEAAERGGITKVLTHGNKNAEKPTLWE